MSYRYMAMFVAAAGTPTVINFNTAQIQLGSLRFNVNTVRINFNTAKLQISAKDFEVERGTINYDNGFMAF